MSRPISAIANDILQEWTNVSVYAKPYLAAMQCINHPDDTYIAEDGKTIVLYFLSNASSFRGPKAKELKAELKELIK
jgi:hypothetical protein